ncbi:hypothetical protein ABZW03_00620 [Kitasatospora sp. NPDC004799]|uniref:hypothetical protein n=1 Tax=Kitasatospora sp. NPDC004799 TaxID=3154460 RepID=UPI0033A7F800
MSAEHDGPDERFERAFAEAIGAAGGAYDADAARLVDTGWSYGRRLRRRRRLGTAAGAAALALVGVGGAALGGLLPGQGGTAAVGAAAAPTGPPVSGPEFQRMLTELLPPGAVTVGEARGTESDTPQLRLVLDDGRGAVQYLFWITRSAAGSDTGCPSGVVPGDACTESDVEGGGHLRIYQAGTRVGEPAGSKTWSAKLTVDGYQMLLQEWNRKPLEQGAPITRTDPPLTPDQLAAVVKDPRWQRVMAAIPQDPRAGTSLPIPRSVLPVPLPTPLTGPTQFTVEVPPVSGPTPPPGGGPITLTPAPKPPAPGDVPSTPSAPGAASAAPGRTGTGTGSPAEALTATPPSGG